MQRIEHGVRLGREQLLRQIVADGSISTDVETFVPQRLRAALAGDEADLALGGTSAQQHGHALEARHAHAHAFDFPFEFDAEFRLHPRAHLFAERFDVGGGGVARVDQEVAMLLADLAPPMLQTAATGLSISCQALCALPDS